MNEIFNTKRFVTLAKLCYRENWKLYLLILMLAMCVAWVTLAEGNPFLIEYQKLSTQTLAKSEITGVVEHPYYQKQQYPAFWIGWLIVAVGTAFNELRKYNRKNSNASAFLIPVSNTERYVLALFNVTILSSLAWVCCFYAINWFVASYKYVFWYSDGGGYSGSVLFWESLNFYMEGIREDIRPALANVFDFATTSKKTIEAQMLAWLMCGILWAQAIYMLGSLTFKRQAPLLIFLAQLSIVGIASYLCYHFIKGSVNAIGLTRLQNLMTDQIAVSVAVDPTNIPGETWLIGLAFLFPICYFWAVFQRLRDKQI